MKLPLWLRWRSDHELDEEIQGHLEFEIQNNLSRGMTAEEARFAAIRTFGNSTRVRERVRLSIRQRALSGRLALGRRLIR